MPEETFIDAGLKRSGLVFSGTDTTFTDQQTWFNLLQQ
jgi:hypothetical protein